MFQIKNSDTFLSNFDFSFWISLVVVTADRGDWKNVGLTFIVILCILNLTWQWSFLSFSSATALDRINFLKAVTSISEEDHTINLIFCFV